MLWTDLATSRETTCAAAIPLVADVYTLLRTCHYHPQPDGWGMGAGVVLLEMTGVVKHYRRGDEDVVALAGVDLDVAAGELVALVGPSGSGKSTLCRLIAGIWAPASGHVRLDGAEVHTWDRADFGRHVGYLPQDVELFAGTVRDNIARMTAAPDEAVIEAARLAGAHDMILRLRAGYGTEIGPQGGVLSGGQRQWIGLARAMFGEPRLIVLDEPNASLDQAGEAALIDAIGRLKARGTTVILVAHRPSLLVHVDKLLILREGAAVLFGPRDEVLPRLMVQRAPAVTAVSA
jgi:ATP-binding cassette subfamily C exporter for protease/lipase